VLSAERCLDAPQLADALPANSTLALFSQAHAVSSRYNRGVSIAQEDDHTVSMIDESSQDFSAAVTAVTTAFGDPTRREIYLFVREGTQKLTPAGSGHDAGRASTRPAAGSLSQPSRQGPPDLGVTVSEVAARFDLHPNVARHHLERLAAGGYLDVTLERPGPNGVGRPSKRYRANAQDGLSGLGRLPARKDDLLVLLLEEAITRLGPKEAECMAEEVGERYGRALALQMAPGDSLRSLSSAMQAVADALTAHGFDAHAEKRASTNAVIAGNCPFGEAAAAQPAICALDRGLVRGMLETLCGSSAVQMTMSSKARGDDMCAAVI